MGRVETIAFIALIVNFVYVTYIIKKRSNPDIAQQFTIFPDGSIMTSRSLGIVPAGIKGANTGAACIEVRGNFDAGEDEMSEEQQIAAISVVKVLLSKFKLSWYVYHARLSGAGLHNCGCRGDCIRTGSDRS